MDFQVIKGKDNLQKIVRQLSIWHNETPRLWLNNYEPSEEDIQKSMDRMMSKECFVAVAKDTSLKGFLWAEPQERGVMILSLYVDPDARKQQVATRLKEMLEDWCQQEGIKKILTTVHATNDRMLALNDKMGYRRTMITMEKDVSK